MGSSVLYGLEEGVALVLFARLPPVLSYLPGIWERDDGPEAISDEARTRAANDVARTKQQSFDGLVGATSHDATQTAAP